MIRLFREMSGFTLGALIALFACAPALAGMGQPSDWQLGLQDSASAVKDNITQFHWFLLVIITAIVIFVLLLLLYCIVRFNSWMNPKPSKTTHNVVLEVAWTLIPAVILAVVAVPSWRLLRHELDLPKPDLVVKATGHAWYWNYEYPDHGKIRFDSLMVEDKDLKPGQPRLLAVDNALVVPVNKNVLLHVTAADVIHAFALPAFGVKIDAMPGRLNQTWFRADREGVYYGQCSELCGKNHAFMPIEIRVVSEAEFSKWLVTAKAKFASAPGVSLADAR